MHRELHTQRSAIASGLDLHMPVPAAEALANTGQAYCNGRIISKAYSLTEEAAAAIFDVHAHVILTAFQYDSGVSTSGVSEYIEQTLLNDSKQVHFHLAAELRQ